MELFFTVISLFKSFRPVPVAFLREIFAIFPTDSKSTPNYAFFYTYIEFSQKMVLFYIGFLYKKNFQAKTTRKCLKRKTSVIMCLTILFCIHIRFVMHNFVKRQNQCSLMSIPPTAYILCVLV
jgi:hypothetical protein